MKQSKISCLSDKNMNNGSLKIKETEWLTTKEAAIYLRTSEAFLRNKVSQGKIPHYKFGRSNRYLKSELQNLLSSQKRGDYNGN